MNPLSRGPKPQSQREQRSGLSRPPVPIKLNINNIASALIAMSTTNAGGGSLFYALSAEMILQIGHNLSDHDLSNFSKSCTKVQNHLAATGYSFFRHRFLKEFDYPNFALTSTGQQLIDNKKFYEQYKIRKSVLKVIDVAFQAQRVKPQLSFDKGQTKKETAALQILRDLIVEAFSVKPGQITVGYESKNLNQILSFLEKSNLFQVIGQDSSSQKHTFGIPSDPKTNFLYAVQCALAPALFALDKPWSDSHMGFPDAQMMAYADNITAPVLFGACGADINMQWLLRNLQFWHQHLNRKTEALADAFEALATHDRPTFHTTQIVDCGYPLGRYWKGSYAFLERGLQISNTRSGKSWDDPIMDQLNGEDDPDHPFQDLVLKFPSDASAGTWPRAFEKHLSSLKMPINRARTRAQLRANGPYKVQNFTEMSTRMQGRGQDSDDDFQADGWLNPLPPQHGIPGWQRMTLMKYFREADGAIDLENLWAYEGIVLPGGKIMVGRWWCPSDGEGDRMYSGPFILWNVQRSPEAEDGEAEGESDGEDG